MYHLYIVFVFIQYSKTSVYLSDACSPAILSARQGFQALLIFLSAIKSNTDPVILELLVNLGIGFDCASKVRI